MLLVHWVREAATCCCKVLHSAGCFVGALRLSAESTSPAVQGAGAEGEQYLAWYLGWLLVNVPWPGVLLGPAIEVGTPVCFWCAA